MTTLKINIPNLGTAPGTTNFAAKRLSEINDSLKIGTFRKNIPCLCFTDVTGNNEKKSYILCFPAYCTEDSRMYLEMNGCYVLHPTCDDYREGLFAYLTPAAEQSVLDYLDKVTKEFITNLNKL